MDPTGNPPSIADVRAAIKEELDRNNKYLEFAQAQIEKDRSFYKHLATVAATALGLILAIAGAFTVTSVTQMRSDMEKSLDAELQKIHAEAGAATAESKQTVAEELTNVRNEVQKRVDNEFKSENINATVRDAAQRIGQKEVQRLVGEEVAKQVASVVAEERSGIDAAARLANLVNGASDLFQPNRRFFDEIVRIANLHNGASPPAKDAADQIVQHWEDNFKTAKFGTTEPPNFVPEEFERQLKAAKDLGERRVALMRYAPEPDSGKRAVPTLIDIFVNDPDLYAAAVALFKFNQIEHTSFRVGDWAKAKEHWTSQKQ